jgi:hypothetical protein
MGRAGEAHSSQDLYLRLCLLQPEPHVHLAAHRHRNGEVLLGPLALADAPAPNLKRSSISRPRPWRIATAQSMLLPMQEILGECGLNTTCEKSTRRALSCGRRGLRFPLIDFGVLIPGAIVLPPPTRAISTEERTR